MLAARARDAGMDVEFESFKDLDNGEVDEKIKEIESFAGAKEVAQKGVTAPEVSEVNGARFGMVYKIVRDYWMDQEIERDPKRFEDAVVAEYERATKTAAAVAASSGGN